jgi:hypothetical protein
VSENFGGETAAAAAYVFAAEAFMPIKRTAAQL